MAWVSQVSVDTTATADAGWCLWLAEQATGAPHLYPSARAAWDAANDKHADRDYPTDAVVALFWDWTSKSDGVNYGHVVINVPGSGLFSSPKNWGVHGNDWYGSIDEVSSWLGATYLGWTSDLAGLQLSAWDGGAVPTPSAPAVGSQGEGIAAEGADWTYWVPSVQDQMTVQAGLVLGGTYSGPIDGNLASDASVRAIQLVAGNHGFFDLNYFDGQMNKNLCHAILLMAQAYGGYTGRMDWQIDGHVWAAFDTAVRATAPAPVSTPPIVPVVVPPVVETPVVDVPVVDAPVDVPVVVPIVKEPIVADVIVPPVKVVLTADEIAAQKVQIASLPSADLGAIIGSVKARKIAYSVFALVSLVVTNTAIAFSTLQAPFPAWLLVSIGIVGNLAVPFAALAVANSKVPASAE